MKRVLVAMVAAMSGLAQANVDGLVATMRADAAKMIATTPAAPECQIFADEYRTISDRGASTLDEFVRAGQALVKARAAAARAKCTTATRAVK